jgi:hypothetical protein
MMTQTWRLSAICLAVLLSCGGAIAFGKKVPKPVQPVQRFDREQFMVLNLNRGPGSTGGYLEDSRKRTFQTVTELQKALHQLQQVETTFVKSRGRPDDHILPVTSDRLKAALKSADDLLNEIRDAEKELKGEIQQVMIMNP